MSAAPICPCDVFVHPRPISNPPGLDAIDYRAGDFASFRHALLLALPGELQLVNWRPSASTDLALQLVEWWAYLADVLTLYDERIANESYLRTADLPESVNRLILTLGYRPRPGIGAHGVVAALVSGTRPPALPAGFQIQSKPGPGKQPQIFELASATSLALPDAVDADPPADGSLVPGGGAEPGALLDGTVTSVKPGDELLVLSRSWPDSIVAPVGGLHALTRSLPGLGGTYAVTTAAAVRQLKDPRGRPQTLIVFADDLPSLRHPHAAGFRLLAAPSTAHPWQYGTSPVFGSTRLDLDAVTRSIVPGSPVLFEIPGSTSPAPLLVRVTGVTEAILYANGVNGDPAVPPDPATAAPIPIPHSQIQYESIDASVWEAHRSQVQIRYGWRELGPLLDRPAPGLEGTAEVTLTAVAGKAFPDAGGRQVLVADGAGNGALGTVEQGGTATHLTVEGLAGADGGAPSLAAPLQVLFDVLEVSRGAGVAGEVLGSGDASLAGQEFTLQKSPLTYLQKGAGYASTLHVRVDGVEWAEAASFFGQAPGARIFVTSEDEKGVTHVHFGDGVEGARLPTGTGNVVAGYRYGSGADAPDAGTLNVIVKPLPGLRAIVDPLAVGGGADPDPPDRIRRYAPDSVLTFGRAVSLDDYEVIAAQAPGVARARAYWSWDPGSQRALPVVYVGDDGNAVAAARAALAGADDPNRPIAVRAAAPVELELSLAVERDPAYVWSDVQAGVHAALADPDTGLLGAGRVRIGAGLFRSRISAACLAVPGVVAVHDVAISSLGQPLAGPRVDPGEGAFFQLAAGSPSISEEAAGGA